MKADLHLHSTASDGTCAPDELVRRAHAQGLTCVALTDHDSVAGIAQAREAARALGVRLIAGVELSCGAQKEIHVLGYGVDPENAALLAFCERRRAQREERAERIVAKLVELGRPVPMERVRELARGVVARPHIARAMVEAGHVATVAEAFDRYIGDHCKCYVGRLKVASTDAVRLIKEAGGTAILAHPLLYGLSNTNLQKMIDELKPAGLDGLEAIYSNYTTGEEQQMKRLARENGLLISGGSDFHGSNKPDIALGRGRGHLYIPYSILDGIKAHR